MTAPPLRHRLEYLVFRLARGLLRALPESWALGLGSALGWFAGSVLRIRRGVVEANLARAFPDRDPAWRRRIAAESWRHLGREGVATFRFAGESAERVRERTEVVGLHLLDEARTSDRRVILITGHLGNWEMGGAALAVRGVPVDAVAFRQRNRLFDRDLVETRARLGVRVIPRGRASRDVFHSLEEGRMPALVADQNAGERGLFVDFFGIPASTARGPAVFARRSGALSVLGVAVALPGRPHRYRLHLEAIPFEPGGDVSGDVHRLTAATAAALERWVRKHPEQYFWQHKRWKTRPREGENPPAERWPAGGPSRHEGGGTAGTSPAGGRGSAAPARNRLGPDGL